MRPTCALVSLCLLLTTLPGTDSKCATASSEAVRSEDAQDVLFLSRSRPVVLRFRIRVDGRPFLDAWREHLRDVFEQADADGDGAWAADESPPGGWGRSEAEAPDRTFRGLPAVDPGHPAAGVLESPELWHADLAPPDGRVTFAELAGFLARRNGPPFRAETDAASGAVRGPAPVNTGGGSELFNLLDTSRDNALTRAELKRAAESLRSYDLDEDDLISLGELRASQNPFFSRRQRNGDRAETPFFCLFPHRSHTKVIRALFERYSDGNGSAPPGKIPRNRLGLTEDNFARFDTDGDDALDDAELRRFLDNPVPDAELVVRLGKRDPSQPAVALFEADREPRVEIRESNDGLVSVVVGDVQIELTARRVPEGRLERGLRVWFRRADADKNEYVDLEETKRFPRARRQFARLDADGDGKLFEDELWKAARQQIAISRSRVELEAADRGQDLFQILDGDRNRALSPREFLLVAQRLALWDGNEDGKLASREVPHVYSLSFTRALPDLPGMNLIAGSGRSANATDSSTSAPAWFRGMDTNGDGDLTPNEFLGPLPQFDKLDRNGDGLVDAGEAAERDRTDRLE